MTATPSEDDLMERATKNGNAAAGSGETGVSGDSRLISKGLTKRELFAAMAMQGFLATSGTGPGSIEDFAKDAVQAADALLKELAK